MLYLAFCILLSKLNDHIYIYIEPLKERKVYKRVIPIFPTNRGSGPPLLWPLMTRNYVIIVLTTTPKFISTREALLLLLHLLENLTRTQKKKIVEKEGGSCWKGY